jgi:hypothetical protein
MNTISGTIINIQPDGGYQSQNGYICTFQMTIQTADGSKYIGQIGSKSQTYPLAVGQPINVEVNNTEHGVRFKKFNPQYGAAQQVAPQVPSKQPQSAPKSTKEVSDDVWEAKDLRMARMNALNRAVDLLVAGKIEIGSAGLNQTLIDRARVFVDFIYTGDSIPF